MINSWKKEGTERETKGDKTFGKGDTPSKKEKQEGVHREREGDKTRGRQTPSNKGYNRRQDPGKVDTPSNTKVDTLRKH